MKIEQLTHQEDITIVKMYASHIVEPIHIKQILIELKGKINSITMIAREFNVPLSTVDISSRQKINKVTVDLNKSMDQVDLTGINIYYILPPPSKTSLEQFTVLGETGINAGIATVQWGTVESHISVSARHTMKLTLQINEDGKYD